MAGGEGFGRVEDLYDDEEGEESRGDAQRNDGNRHCPGDIAATVQTKEEAKDCTDKDNGAGEVDAAQFRFPVAVFLGGEVEHDSHGDEGENAEGDLSDESPGLCQRVAGNERLLKGAYHRQPMKSDKIPPA